MWNKSSLLIMLLLGVISGKSQDCNYHIQGEIQDAETGRFISYVNIYIYDLQQGDVSDSIGQFVLHHLCRQSYQLKVSCVGYQPQVLDISVKGDTVLAIQLVSNSELLKEVAVVGTAGNSTTQETTVLDQMTISENGNKNLANMLENIAGVSTIKSGNKISKPVVQGLYGNRLTLLNNGVVQSGQQWGIDHSPEIDPLTASKISVVKGASALEYMGSSLGSVVIVEPGAIPQEEGWHGMGMYIYETNGRGHGANFKLRRYKNSWAWRLTGTVKQNGDLYTPDYYLTNTGSKEANMALQIEKKITDRWKAEVYISSFNSEVGILRGSHIGNLTDLKEALNREEPFFTQSTFSYAIAPPKQKVNHHLLKLHSQYTLDSNQWVEVTYAAQLDLRKEFDVRRGGRSEKPALSLNQWAHFVEGKFHGYYGNNWSLVLGIQYRSVDNTNTPETNILPLIPDYLSDETGAFVTVKKQVQDWTFETGVRWNRIDQRVVRISNGFPREIIRTEKIYHTFGVLGGVQYAMNEKSKLALNVGLASRNPAVNELYSNGLHQGVGGIEEGDPNLDIEKSFKTTLSWNGKLYEKWTWSTEVYYQSIQDYIYLNPQDEIRLTIRGAFPVFKYEQTHAQIMGWDAVLQYQPVESVLGTVKYSWLKGDDLTNNLGLINMPSNSLFASIEYTLSEWSVLKPIQLELNNRYVFQQTNIVEGQDFVLPPNAYNLVGVKISGSTQIKKMKTHFFVNVDNVFNVKYRDYLNRQRYFADDIGTNIVLGLEVSF
jgi:iron complex outermembrane receptor protein